MLSDLRFAVRQLAQAPGFSATIIVTLALGIAACTAIFSVIDGIVLNPLPYAEPDRLVSIWETKLPVLPKSKFAPTNFRDLEDEAGVFVRVFGFSPMRLNLTGTGEPIAVAVLSVTSAFFETLGVQPMLGRTFGRTETDLRAERLIVLSDGLWRRQFGGRPEIVGETIRLDGHPVLVLGVMPPGFGAGFKYSEAFVSEACQPAPFHADSRRRHIAPEEAVARLKPGVTLEQARAQLDALASRLAAAYPDTNAGWGFSVTPWRSTTGSFRSGVYVLLAAVLALLLVACANAANLLLARGTSRRRELSLRTALGAGRWRVVCLLFTESMVLALLAGLGGVVLASWGLDALLAFGPSIVRTVSLDARIIAVALAVSIFTTLIFGLLPALQCSQINLVDALKDGGRGAGDSGRQRTLRHAFVVTQVALALMLLAGAGLLIRSFVRIVNTDVGFRPENTLRVNLQASTQKYGTPEKVARLGTDIASRIRVLPGVTDVAIVSPAPFHGDLASIHGVEAEGRDAKDEEMPLASRYYISPGGFKLLGIRMVQGRDFSDVDRSGVTPVCAISQTLARRLFGDESPIGRRVRTNTDQIPTLEVIAVVRDIKHNLFRETPPQIYLAFLQFPFQIMSIVARVNVEPNSLAPAARREVYAVDPEQPVRDVESLDSLIAQTTHDRRFTMILLTVFSAVAFTLAAVGIYAVVAYTVAQRTTEIGIRMALGASTTNVLQMVMRQGMIVVAIGVALGVSGMLALARLIESMLYQTAPNDPLTLGAITLLLTGVAALACWLPARRATKVNPIVALRAE